MIRRLLAACALGSCPALASTARSQAIPQAQLREPLTIMAPAAPGGGWDQTARLMQQVIQGAALAPSAQVVNAAGAAGTIGLARFVTAERGNGNALLVTGLVMVSGIVTNHSPVTLADVTPIARLSGEFGVIVVPAASPIRSLPDLVAELRRNPRGVSWGGGSAGGTDEILARLIADAVGVSRDSVNYVAYSGGGQALASILGGHVTAGVSGLGEFAGQIESGALRALAISSPERIAAAPTIPTLIESGVDVSLMNWRGVVAPPGITRAERARLEALVAAMAGAPAWREALARNGWTDLFLGADAFGDFIRDETRRIGPLVAQRKASAVPWGVGIVVAGTLALLLVGARGGSLPAASIGARSRVTLLGIALAALVGLPGLIGFVPSAAVAFTCIAHAFGSTRVLRNGAIGTAFAVAAFLLFAKVLGIALPPLPF